jgi:hypothetical protein
MPRKTLVYNGIILLITSIFYHETFGLNVFIFSLIIVGAGLVNQSETPMKSKLTSNRWWMASLVLLANGFGVFYSNSILPLILIIPSVFYYIIVSHSMYSSIIASTINGIISFGLGIGESLQLNWNLLTQKKGVNSKKIIVRILLISIPLVLAIIFLKLYQQADSTFYEWTKFINLDWISIEFIFFYLLLLVVLRGLFYVHSNKDVVQIDRKHSEPINPSYSDRIQQFFGVENEKSIAYSVLILLNLMLLLYNIIDVRFVLTELPNPSSTGSTYSQLVHGGINALIFSIVLVILILVFLFRGQLNFESKPALKYLAFSWLFLNSVMVITSLIKNYEYVSHWGLTYKRIGVFIYLILALIGLIFCILKINQQLSAYRLIRKMGFTFLIAFTCLGMVNWNKYIAHHNLTQLETSKIDFDYLASLGAESTPVLLKYFQEHPNDKEIYLNELWQVILDIAAETKHQLKLHSYKYTWLSFNYSLYQLEKALDKFDLEEMRLQLKKTTTSIVQYPPKHTQLTR